MKSCKNCKIERENIYFLSTLINNKRYYNTKKCKICKGIKTRLPNEIKIENDISISKECFEFLDELKKKKYYCDLIDSYKIGHYFTETFGDIKIPNLEIEEQLEFMLEKLVKEKKNRLYSKIK